MYSFLLGFRRFLTDPYIVSPFLDASSVPSIWSVASQKLALEAKVPPGVGQCRMPEVPNFRHPGFHPS